MSRAKNNGDKCPPSRQWVCSTGFHRVVDFKSRSLRDNLSGSMDRTNGSIVYMRENFKNSYNITCGMKRKRLSITYVVVSSNFYLEQALFSWNLKFQFIWSMCQMCRHDHEVWREVCIICMPTRFRSIGDPGQLLDWDVNFKSHLNTIWPVFWIFERKDANIDR